MMETPSQLPPTRCDAGERRRVLDAAFALGIPRDYGRRHRLRAVREPGELRAIGEDIHGRQQWLAPRAARAWLKMQRQAAKDGIVLQVVSAFRSATYQLVIVERKLERGQSIAEILRVSAAPGFSEHHSGRAVDISTPGFAALEEEFESSAAFHWLQRHAGNHGFALSFPRDNPHAIAYEPWHWCWRRR
jgi:D-alanyl-D-alanine carboxypeptidase